MLKILPILITPLFFLIVYLGVENLTQNNIEKDFDGNQKEVKYTEKKENKSISNNTNLKIKDTEQEISIKKNNDSFDLNRSDSANTEVKKGEKIIDKVVNKTDSNGENLLKKEIYKANKKKTTEIAKDTKGILIQFGAFSRKDYAESSKESIEKKLTNKFKDVTLNIDFEKGKKLYKLLFKTKDENLAKSICEFSKKININCLIRK